MELRIIITRDQKFIIAAVERLNGKIVALREAPYQGHSYVFASIKQETLLEFVNEVNLARVLPPVTEVATGLILGEFNEPTTTFGALLNGTVFIRPGDNTRWLKASATHTYKQEALRPHLEEISPTEPVYQVSVQGYYERI